MFNPYPKIQTAKAVKKVLLKSRKSTGEMIVFKMIWKERPHHSQIAPMKYLGEVLNPCFFSHILPKGKYPRFRLYKKNIILKTPDEHTLWQDHQEQIKTVSQWKWIFKLEEELKKEYEQLYPARAKKIIYEQ